jgi:hypothetical protein
MGTAYPGNLDSFEAVTNNEDVIDESHINDLQAAIYALEVKVGKNTSTDVTSLDHKVNKFFVTSRTLWILNASPPTGWQTHSARDVVLGVKGTGVGGQYGVANAYAGTWTQPAHQHTMAHTHSLTTASRPHWDGGVSGYFTHLNSGATGGVSTGSTGWGAGAVTYRPSAIVGIIITKN